MLTKQDIVVGGCYLNQYDTVYRVTHISNFWPINKEVTYQILDLNGNLTGQNTVGLKGFLAVLIKRVQVKRTKFREREAEYPTEFRTYEAAWIQKKRKAKPRTSW